MAQHSNGKRDEANSARWAKMAKGLIRDLATTTPPPESLIDTFVARPDVIQATQQYAAEIRNLWKKTPPTAVSTMKPPTPSAPDHRPFKPSFHLRNGKVGEFYEGKITGSESGGRQVSVSEIRGAEDLGLTFDRETQSLRGTPGKDGDHKLPVLWTLDGKTHSSSECLLIINPNPRSLWKVIEPPADAPFGKPHAAHQSISAGDARIAAASRRGRSHEHSGGFRDDDFFVAHDEVNGWSVLLVADGAGSAKLSREGSRLAVQHAGRHLIDSLSGELGARMTAELLNSPENQTTTTRMGEEFYYLFHKAASLAVRAIEQESARQHGTTPRDYATTLLAAVVRRLETETLVSTFWMGDGAIAVYVSPGKVQLMGAPDGGEYAGQTRFLDRTALSDPACSNRVSTGRFTEIEAVILMTDGISDPRFETDNGLGEATRWDHLWQEWSAPLAAPDPGKELVEWLNFFTPGHHDDRTVALLWNRTA